MAGPPAPLAPPPAPPAGAAAPLGPTPGPAPGSTPGPTAWHTPAGLGAATVLGTIALGLGDPNTTHVPLCPLKFLTGLDCPACGSLRAVHGLAHLDVPDALGHNALFVLLVPFLVLGWGVWMGRSLGHPVLGDRRWPRHTGLALLVVAAVFAVARNTPAFAALASA